MSGGILKHQDEENIKLEGIDRKKLEEFSALLSWEWKFSKWKG